MLHLDPERLAALADDEPTSDESAHLATCASCAADVAAYRAVAAAAARERNTVLAQPLTDWDSLAARLRTEGLMRPAARTPLAARPWMRAAAAAVLVLGGAAFGRASARWPASSGDAAQQAAANVGDSAARLAGAVSAGDTLASVDNALAVMRRAASDYRIAAAYIAAHDTATGSGGVDRYRTRLAALDRVNDAVLAAVNEAPTDLVLNQYLMSTRAARAVTLAQLSSSLPQGARLTSW